MEIFFCGLSGAGKTTLISALIQKLSAEFDIGYIKHDGHHFEMDREGKDTWKAQQAGAKFVHISDDKKNASLNSLPLDSSLLSLSLVDMDIVLIEGHKKSLGRKLVVLGSGEIKKKAIHALARGEFENVLAVIGDDEKSPIEGITYFERNQIDKISGFLVDDWSQKCQQRPVYGLILGGGRSQRMGQDKGALQYFGQEQTKHLYQMLETLVEKTFLSCRNEQANDTHLVSLPVIKDIYLGFGPTGGILSAMNQYPNVDWLVLACDLPYLTVEVLQELISKRNPFKVATCFTNPEKGWPEPLCTIYSSKAKIKLGQFLALGHPCPRKVLFSSNILRLELPDSLALQNVNTPEDFQRATLELNRQRMTE